MYSNCHVIHVMCFMCYFICEYFNATRLLHVVCSYDIACTLFHPGSSTPLCILRSASTINAQVRHSETNIINALYMHKLTMNINWLVIWVGMVLHELFAPPPFTNYLT